MNVMIINSGNTYHPTNYCNNYYEFHFAQIQEVKERNTFKIYWKHLSAVVIGCISLLIFDMCERGEQLRNPFYSIWASKIGSHLAVSIYLFKMYQFVYNAM